MSDYSFKQFAIRTEGEQPTSGEMLVAIFDGITEEYSEYAPLVNTNLDGSLVSFLADWWDAPYTGLGGGR